jgi:hypothetical protein
MPPKPPLHIKHTDDIQVDHPVHIPTPAESIGFHWQDLNGAPGAALSGVEPVPGGHRVRYQNGAIYDGRDATAWVYGAIGERYDTLGGAGSWLGLPLADEGDFEGGRVSRFQHGDVYWWPDVGAIDIDEVIVHYTGLICFGEMDSDQTSDSDEPYVVLGVLTPAGQATFRTRIYDDVDGGEGVGDLIELYRGKPLGISIHSLLMEYDYGDPDRYEGAMKQGVAAGYTAMEEGLDFVPIVGPLLSKGARAVREYLEPLIAEWLNALLDTDDDAIGIDDVVLSPKQMVVLAARTQNSTSRGVGFKAETQLLSSGHGESYKVYFGLIPA